MQSVLVYNCNISGMREVLHWKPLQHLERRPRYSSSQSYKHHYHIGSFCADKVIFSATVVTKEYLILTMLTWHNGQWWRETVLLKSNKKVIYRIQFSGIFSYGNINNCSGVYRTWACKLQSRVHLWSSDPIIQFSGVFCHCFRLCPCYFIINYFVANFFIQQVSRWRYLSPTS